MAEQDLRSLQTQRIIRQVQDAVCKAMDYFNFQDSKDNFPEAIRSNTENLLKKIAKFKGYSEQNVKVKVANQEKSVVELSMQMPKEMAEEIGRG